MRARLVMIALGVPLVALVLFALARLVLVPSTPGANTPDIAVLDRVYCSAFREEFLFYRGCRGSHGLPLQSYVRLVVVKNGERQIVADRAALVGLVQIETPQQALDFVRLFSQRETHYLFGFHDSDFLELPKYETGTLEWGDTLSVGRARKAGIPIDNPPVEIAESGGTFRVARYVVDWSNNVYRVVESVGRDGTYRIEEKTLIVADIRVVLPVYR